MLLMMDLKRLLWLIGNVGGMWVVGVLPGLYHSIRALQSRPSDSQPPPPPSDRQKQQKQPHQQPQRPPINGRMEPYADLLERWLVYWPALFVVHLLGSALEAFYGLLLSLSSQSPPASISPSPSPLHSFSSPSDPSILLCLTYLMAKWACISWIAADQASGAVQLFASIGIPLYQGLHDPLKRYGEAVQRSVALLTAWIVVNGWEAILWAKSLISTRNKS